MWRGILLGTLCLIACHRPPAPPSEAPQPTTTVAEETRSGESGLTSRPDAGGRWPHARPRPRRSPRPVDRAIRRRMTAAHAMRTVS